MNEFDLTEGFYEAIKQYKLLTENTVECIWLLDLANRRYKYVSPSVTSLRGFSVTEAMGESYEESLTPESLKKLKQQNAIRMPKFLSGDRSEGILSSIDEFQQYCKDGTIKTIEISTKLIYNPDTKFVDVLGVSRDITERKNFETHILRQLEEKNTLLKELLHRPKNGIVEDTSKIYCFGKFSVYGDESDSVIKWRTSKSEEIFAFMLKYNGSKIPKYEICESLWPGCDRDKVDNLLHTSLYKMKSVLKANNIKYDIKFKNGSYWMFLPDAYMDFAEFDYLVGSDMNVNEKTLASFEKAFYTYRGEYLEGCDYMWATPVREAYEKKFLDLSEALVTYYIEMKDHSSAKKLLKVIVERCPFCELAHKTLLRLYFVSRDRISFLTHYDAMTTLLSKEYGIEPSASMQALYRSILEA